LVGKSAARADAPNNPTTAALAKKSAFINPPKLTMAVIAIAETPLDSKSLPPLIQFSMVWLLYHKSMS
jgi:hypothetical protein